MIDCRATTGKAMEYPLSLRRPKISLEPRFPMSALHQTVRADTIVFV